jgi:drug/metabolite transporter (DMT)-like permease
LSAIGPVAAALGVGALMLTPGAIAVAPSASLTVEALGSIFVLGAICSALGLFLFFRLITEVGAGRASVVTYINPVVAVALGVGLLGESLGAGAAVGLLLILAGSWLSTDGRVPLVGRLKVRPSPASERDFL